MELLPRSVIVPLAGASSGALIEVRADNVPPQSNDEGFDPQLAQLFGWSGLYQSGATAVAAVRRLRLGAVGLGRLRALRGNPVSGYLSIANARDTDGLAPDQSRSAELGLALALIAYGGQSKATAIAATGRIDASPRPGQAADRTVRVEPVGELGTKIGALAAFIDARAPADRTDHLCLFVPARTLDGENVIDAHKGELYRLRAACAAQSCALEVYPVETLNDAVVRLCVRGMLPTWTDRILAGGLGSAASVGVGLLAWTSFLDAPIRLSFEDIVLADGTATTSPIRAVFEQSQGAFVMRPQCLGAQATAMYRPGDTLIMRVGAASEGWLTRRLGGHRYVIAAVSEKSGVLVLPPESFAAAVKSGGDIVRPSATPSSTTELLLGLPVTGPSERTKLIVLAKRASAFDAAGLRKNLEAAVAGKPEAERINAATAVLARAAPGYLDYSFRSVETDFPCTQP